VIWDGSTWKVNLPHYHMVPGTFEPVIPTKTNENGVLPKVDPTDPDLVELTVECMVPDRLLTDDKTALDKAKVRDVYHRQPLWDHDQVTDDV